MSEEDGASNRRKALEVVVSGHVQGVGYRFFCQRKAHKYGIGGWARNCPDGTVQVRAFGFDEAVEKFVVDLGKGPRFGRVDDVLVRDISETNTAILNEFSIK